MDEYIGRVNELEMLESRWKSEEFEFGAIYGRRRVGKTRLVQKFMEGKKGIYFLATKDREYNLLKFSRAIGQALFGTPDIVPFTSFAAAFSVIENHVGNERIVVAIDEISYAYESDKTILSVLQSFIDQGFRNTRIFLILCGSNMSFIENNVLGIKSPVYGRRTFQIKLHPFLLKETSLMLPAWSLEDVAASHVITGGIPYYLTFIRQHGSLKEAVKAEFFSPGGRLYTEGRLHLMMELRSWELYDLLLVIIASGVNEVSKIADKSAKDMSIISQALQKLANLGIVRRRTKIAGKGIDRGWVFRDRFFQFLYQYVYPYSEMIESGVGEAAYQKAVAELPSFTGHGMEDVFREYVLTHSGLLITEIGNVEFPDPSVRRNEEMDLVALVSDGSMAFGEVKWRNEAVGAAEYNELERISIIAYPSVRERRYYMLSRSGFMNNLKEFAARSDGMITLIDGGALLDD